LPGAKSFSSGGRTWTVTDYVGRTEGMPAVVTALEDEVDRVAGTARWINGNQDSVAALLAGGFDFTSRRAMQAAANNGPASTGTK
jgi:alpha/beta superfamily hydrolase